MSKETLAWLNTNILIGFTDKRRRAWHYRASDQGEEPNHYPGAIPVEDVLRRLFSWDAVKGTATATFVTEHGVTTVEDTKRFPVGRADTGEVFGYFADGYEIHQYREWLVTNIANILDSDRALGIGSAGLLKGGAQAWVQVEVPDNVRTPEGVEFRPHLTACTSLDGSLATTYKRMVTVNVCDNTLAAGLRENGQQFKVKHSRYSKLKITEAREALAVIHTVADEFAAEVKSLCETTVTDRSWAAFLDAHAPLPEQPGRAHTLAERQRDALTRLWNTDERVAPWRNTAYGVLAAVNTYAHHEATVRGTSRPERNMARAITGGIDQLDHATLTTLGTVLESS